jgi:hypothetical protein
MCTVREMRKGQEFRITLSEFGMCFAHGAHLDSVVLGPPTD